LPSDALRLFWLAWGGSFIQPFAAVGKRLVALAPERSGGEVFLKELSGYLFNYRRFVCQPHEQHSANYEQQTQEYVSPQSAAIHGVIFTGTF